MIRVSQVLLSGCLLITNLLSAAEADLNIEDRLLIREALTQYSYRWDGKDSEGFARLFTEDGIMERQESGQTVDGSLVQGRDAIYTYALQSHRGRLADRQTRHHFTAIVFHQLTGDHAVTENMALITHQTAGGPPFIASAGIYRITWRKTVEGWKMARRILTIDRFDP